MIFFIFIENKSHEKTKKLYSVLSLCHSSPIKNSLLHWMTCSFIAMSTYSVEFRALNVNESTTENSPQQMHHFLLFEHHLLKLHCCFRKSLFFAAIISQTSCVFIIVGNGKMITGGMENDMQLTPSGRLKPVMLLFVVCALTPRPKGKGRIRKSESIEIC